MQTWRDPAYVAAVRADCTPDQFNRFKRLYRESFYVLEIRAAPGPGIAASILVSGSTPRSSYSVRFAPDGRVTCTCIDAAVNCGRLRCACKHACFAAVRVFRLDAEAIRAWLRTLRLDPGAVAAVEARARTEAEHRDGPMGGVASGPAAPDIDALCEALDRSANVSNPRSRTVMSYSPLIVSGGTAHDFRVVARPPGPGDECPVCYSELSADLLGCPDCGKAIHATCARRWLEHAPRPTCVYCRSEAFIAWDEA
jgi:hypothetical protein